MSGATDETRAAQPGPADASSRRSRIAVLEDDPDQAMLVQRRLERGGYECLAYESVGAFKAASPDPLDLVLLDWWLPDMIGDAAVDAVRESIGDDVPVIFLSARSAESEQMEMLDAGGDDVMVKPIAREHLLLLAGAYTGRLSGLPEYELQAESNSVMYEGRVLLADAAGFALAKALLAAPGRLRLRSVLARTLQKEGLAADETAVEVAVARLVESLGWNQPGSCSLERVLGRGYRLLPPAGA